MREEARSACFVRGLASGYWTSTVTINGTVAILTYAFTVTGDKYRIESDVGANTGTLNDTQKVERFEQLEEINAVYIAAISGSLALGGTLIARLWGRG